MCGGIVPIPKSSELLKGASAPANREDGLTRWGGGLLEGSGECSHQQEPSGVQALPTGLLVQGEGHSSFP